MAGILADLTAGRLAATHHALDSHQRRRGADYLRQMLIAAACSRPATNNWQQLIDDATARGWQREIERHTATRQRIQQLLNDLGSNST